MGEMVCGDPNAFKFNILPEDQQNNNNSDNGNDNENNNGNNEFAPIGNCAKLEMKLKSTELGSFLWPMLAPFLKGFVLYTPMNNFTNALIDKVYNLLYSSNFRFSLYNDVSFKRCSF